MSAASYWWLRSPNNNIANNLITSITMAISTITMATTLTTASIQIGVLLEVTKDCYIVSYRHYGKSTWYYF